jgi:hypothetical protein
MTPEHVRCRPPLEIDADVTSLAHAGSDRLIAVVSRPSGSNALVVRGGDGKLVSEHDLPGDAVQSIRCHGEHWCALLRVAERNHRFDILDIPSMELTRGADCPSEVLCMSGRFSPIDGGHLFVPAASLDSLHVLEPRTGTHVQSRHRIPDGAAIQSATRLLGSTDVLATLLFDEGSPHARYVLARLGEDASFEPLWGSDDTWVVGPVLSPDGSKVAVTGLEFHVEAALLAGVGTGCGLRR